MTENDLKKRTKQFALRVIQLMRALPSSPDANVIGKQLLRSGTSVGANYRSANRAKSTADFIAKMAIVEEEADESSYWMELLVESGIFSQSRLKNLITEADELVAISVASIKTAKKRNNIEVKFLGNIKNKNKNS